MNGNIDYTFLSSPTIKQQKTLLQNKPRLHLVEPSTTKLAALLLQFYILFYAMANYFMKIILA